MSDFLTGFGLGLLLVALMMMLADDMKRLVRKEIALAEAARAEQEPVEMKKVGRA